MIATLDYHWLLELSKVLGALTVIGVFIGYLWRNAIRRALTAWDEQQETVKAVHAQLIPNGGDSLADRINLQERRLASLRRAHSSTDRRLREFVAMEAEHHEYLHRRMHDVLQALTVLRGRQWEDEMAMSEQGVTDRRHKEEKA